MKIASVRSFPPLKSTLGDFLCCPDLDRVVALHWNARDLIICSFATGKKLMVQRFPRSASFHYWHRAGRWLFVRMLGPDGIFAGAFDLQDLVFHDWWHDEESGRSWADYRGATDQFAFFVSTNRDTNQSTAFAFRLEDGALVDLPDPARMADHFSVCYGRFFMITEGLNTVWEGSRFFVGIDQNGMPDMSETGRVPEELEYLAVWDDRMLVKGGTDFPEPATVCYDVRGKVVYASAVPQLPDREVANKKPAIHAVLAPGTSGWRMVVATQWTLRQKVADEWMAAHLWNGYDRDSGERLWQREFVWNAHCNVMSRHALVLGSHLLSHDSAGVDVTDVDTGETERMALPNYHCWSGDGYILKPFGGNHYRDLSSPPCEMRYFFARAELGGTPVMYTLSK